jgi:hypothetical protein
MNGMHWVTRSAWRTFRTAMRRRAGQAVVELALSMTVIAMILGAAVDLGLAFKAYQTLINASAEASSFLDQNPTANCGTIGCDAYAEADRLARERFRTEQGETRRGAISTLDLNANGVDDLSEAGGAALVASMVQIDAADNTQIDATGPEDFALNGTFNPAATDAQCRQRVAIPRSTNPNVQSCYIVIRAQMLYRPFVLRPLLGETMTIRAISVRRIVADY